MRKIRDYYYKDVLKDIYSEEITVRDQIIAVIEEYEKLGGEYSSIIPQLKKIDKAFLNDTLITTGRKKEEPQMALWKMFCNTISETITKIYDDAKQSKRDNEDGSYSFITHLTKEEKERIDTWGWGFWELNYAWKRIRGGEPYSIFEPHLLQQEEGE